uniref:Uncharacterized protein n=1 Tax=Candidatus Kentrum sp. FM TaxID=2126340 RepID=A0A450SS37_9GAMM|nr:MAG: hypothetical protein BECKFM1743A_GA0114220_101776 [Candidatus Kentron sp. FM]VFJ58769.1 MAG: hypothetical protein BECKFM1743C_GA0114222_102334 [Candidatus Kentron sp. FM]VFK17945.1 MAG: hypothetical protein BECKFM1743B_GA0114221_105152 [Candidatus Kentron sp. FM]
MFKKRVFFLTGPTLAVYRERRNPVEPQVSFQDNPEGLREFAHYLDRDPWTPACLLVDLVEEEFRTETIPHVFVPDRRALVANKQRRLFRHTPYRYAVFQDRTTNAKREDNVLFAAVARPDILGRWLHPITQRKIPLTGIYSLPLLSRKLLPVIQGASPASASDYALLVHCNAGGGLRQSFFVRHHLKVSRLAILPGSAIGSTIGPGNGPLPSDDAACTSRYILGEVEKTHRYLSDLRLLSANHPLDVYFLMGAGGPAGLAEHLEQPPEQSPGQQTTEPSNLRYHFVDIPKIGARIGLSNRGTPDKPGALCADALFVRTLMRTTPANHYATPNDVRYFRFLQMRMAMYATGVLLLCAGIAWSAARFSDTLIIGQQTTALERQIRVYEDRYAHARAARLPEMPVDGPSLKAAVETADMLRLSRTTPYPMFVALGAVLDEESALTIQEIEWSVSTGPPSAADVSMSTGTRVDGVLPDRMGNRLRSPSRPSSEAPPAPWRNGLNPIAPYQVALIEGRLAARAGEARGDYRRAMGLVEDFAGKLSRLDGVEHVEIVDRPVNVSSEGTLAGKADGALGTGNFTLRITIRNVLPEFDG